jgi:[glutamine synthetase] adenylyltransferase / [glutamine synthetase]-adenylyl-L-tyrosine phosphorylase
MNESDRIQTYQTQCPDLRPALIRDFVLQMDTDYFESFSSQEIRQHLNLANQLTFDQPCVILIQALPSQRYQFTLVAYDYFSEFATFCGVLSSFGLDIREAMIFTSQESPSPFTTPGKSSRGLTQVSRGLRITPGLTRKIAVDVFQVQALDGFQFGERDQHEFRDTVTALLRLLQKNQIRQVRRQVNRRLIENLGKMRSTPTDLVHAVHITFSNPPGTQDTILDIRSTDTPAFLYTFANALAMRGIYIVKARIEVADHRVRNRLYVRGRQGGKIQGKAEQQELRTAATLLKEFTHYLSWAPDPGKALDHFDQFLDQWLDQPDIPSRLTKLTQASTLEHLAQLFGSSDYLWEDLLRRQHHNLLPMMNQYQKGPLIRSKSALNKAIEPLLLKTKTPKAKKQRLNQWKDEELFRIDMRHLLENTPLPHFSQALTNLADVILHQALLHSQKAINPKASLTTPLSMAIFGLGKLGGGELGYASDIEVLFVYEIPGPPSKNRTFIVSSDYFERWAQEFLQWIDAKQEGIFHLDTRLRPHGEKGLLANSFEEIQRYYAPEGGAAPFERQAWIKLRFIAGNRSLGKAVEHHRDQFVYGPDPWDLDTALHLRDRQRKELVRPGTIHVKYGAGGLLDVEYTVQYLQLLYGHRNPSLRTPNTLEAIDRLCENSLLTLEEADKLKDNYLFLRQLIDGLRIVRGNAQDLVLPPSGSDELVFLARRLGMITTNWLQGAKDLEQMIHVRMTHIHEQFLQRFSKHQRLGAKGVSNPPFDSPRR